MRLKINRSLLTQLRWDSAAISPLASIVHKFNEPGRYKLLVMAGERLDRIGVIDLLIDENEAEEQLNINLESVAKEKFSKANQIVRHANPEKPVVFYTAGGTQKFAIVAYRIDKEKEVRVFDSRQLVEGDTFIVNPLVSGRYSFTGTHGGKGELVIHKKAGRLLPTQGKVVECTAKGFIPNKLESDFLQPVFFLIKTKEPSRLMMQFEKG
ncbi:hypothetical protein [Catalinimonas niigatensis]|uniref:hypothetical protein n=1 Tax=Catalinimonas niigatensis TaxID=1397264 RepID=UPI0026667698|nr:hypothetical protein [Catalinimonas niigatensis]WPP52762.1 hypothetical protein PZB72_10275 [Catalinimonas niigatensis]